jgi:phosphoribosylaminoimidazole-succinocarboxamide synthase
MKISPLSMVRSPSYTSSYFYFLNVEIAKELIGAELYDEIARTSIALYNEANAYALSRGLILADTKFEFGLVPSPSGKKLILIDEALTPDSSRYWSAASYEPGRPQASFDKQFLRDWLMKSAGFRKGLEAGPGGNGWTMSEEVVDGTRDRYAEAVRLLIGDGNV